MVGDIYTNEELFGMAVDRYIEAMDKSSGIHTERALRAAKVLTAQGAFGETKRLADRIDALYGEKLQTEERKELLKLRARIAVAEGLGTRRPVSCRRSWNWTLSMEKR